METISLSINDLLLSFKGSLNSLIPWLERIKMPYDKLSSYDDWDEISSTLFRTIVLNSILNSTEDIDENIIFPEYGIIYENYRDYSFLIIDNESDNYFQVFNEFVCEQTEFNKILVSNIDKIDYTLRETIIIECNDVSVSLFLNMRDQYRIVNRINIIL
jgi:hypothetical protein